MIMIHAYALIFAFAFMACGLSTPMAARVAAWAGAIDRPDHFRRIHKGATPRLGGLSLALGIGVGIWVVVQSGYLGQWSEIGAWWPRQLSVLAASLIVLAVGFVDDSRGIGPRTKLLGQAAAVLVLYQGGIRIQSFELLGVSLDFTHPSTTFHLFSTEVVVGWPSFLLTMLWFLGCMNVWNLIDGMEGLASGVALLASGTLALVAMHFENVGVAVLATALAGSLTGFLLYNWHPACIFLGDSGSLLIGLLIGIIGVEGSLKGPSAISILFPILAMGLPISDTAMAIFRRWVRQLPLSAADRRHVHHLLIGLGLDPRQAALLLYCFSAFLCGAVLLGVALRNEILALILGLSGCGAFLLILTSRRDEMTTLRSDFRARLTRGRQERFAAKLTWDAIQRVELAADLDAIRAIYDETASRLGCVVTQLRCVRDGSLLINDDRDAKPATTRPGDEMSGATASFRLSLGQDSRLSVALTLLANSSVAADIAFRFLQRLALATSERIERLQEPDAVASMHRPAASDDALAGAPSGRADGDFVEHARTPRDWIRARLGGRPNTAVQTETIGEK